MIALFFILVFPFVAHGQGLVPCGNGGDSPPCTYADLVKLVQNVVSFALTYIAIPIVSIIIVVGGIRMAISAGDEAKFKAGRKMITGAAVGLVITFGAWLLINTVLSFLKLPTQ